jgi:N-acetylglucosamine malate deacetylase 1
MTERVLLIAPHPDDEILGCGGSIAKLAAAGHEVRIAYLTSGEVGQP